VGNRELIILTPEETWLTRRSAAIYLTRLGCPVSNRMLEKWAAHNNKGGGPAFVRSGWKAVRYRQADLDAWAKKRMVKVE
jgi:hypothetical protein